MAELTDDPNDPRLGHGTDDSPTPQAKVYLVLSEEERARGFVRPVRHTYIHVGRKNQYPLRDLTAEERDRYAGAGYVKFEEYPAGTGKLGRFWTQADLNARGCGTATTMSQALAETYARQPNFYGSTYCVGCQMHLPVAEFVWEDGSVLGS